MRATKYRARDLRNMIASARRDEKAGKITDAREYIRDQMSFQLSEGMQASDFGLRDLFEQLVANGHEMAQGDQLAESATSVTTADFAMIAEQLAFSDVMKAYTLASLVGDMLATTWPSKFQDSELIPGIAVTADEYETAIPEGKPYPLVGMQPATIRLPAAEKRGGILPITREMIIRDNTGLLLQRAQTVGTGFGLNKEKRIIDTFTGADPSYVRKEEARATYETSVAGTFMGFTNENDHPLVDLTDIREMDETFNQVSEPDIDEPLDIEPTSLICGRDLSWQARNIIRATEVREGDITAAATPQTMHVGNRLPVNLEIIRSEHLTRRIIARNGEGGLVAANRAAALPYWWYGNPKAAFLYKEIWMMTTEQAPINNEAQYESDVWFRIKVSEKGVACVREPRVIIRSDGT